MSDTAGDEIRIDGYRDFARIDVGGFSTVYTAVQERFGRVVAVKVLAFELVDAKTQQRFQRETEVTGPLADHPNVVHVLDSGFTEHGRPFIATEYMKGGSLDDRVAQRGPMSIAMALRIGVKIAGALASLHALDLVHRDIKPQNILLSAFDEPGLADFGIATVLAGRAASTGTFSSTPVHAAPEVLEGAGASQASDIWSFASTLYTIVEGSPPFMGDANEGLYPLMRRILDEPVPPITRPDVPPELIAILQRAMAKDPTQRFASAREMGEALQMLERRLGLPVTEMVAPIARPAVPASEVVADDLAPDRAAGGIPTATVALTSLTIDDALRDHADGAGSPPAPPASPPPASVPPAPPDAPATPTVAVPITAPGPLPPAAAPSTPGPPATSPPAPPPGIGPPPPRSPTGSTVPVRPASYEHVRAGIPPMPVSPAAPTPASPPVPPVIGPPASGVGAFSPTPDPAGGASGESDGRSRGRLVLLAITVVLALAAGAVAFSVASRGEPEAGPGPVVPSSSAPGSSAIATPSSASCTAAGGAASSPSSATPAGGAAGAGSGAGATDATPVMGGTLRFGLADEPEGWDPTRYGFTPSSALVASSIYDPLAVFDDAGAVQPYLADAFDASGDGKEFTIALHPGVRFHDGSALDAESVRTNLEATRSNKLVGPNLEPIATITAKDATTVVVTMKSAWPAFPAVLTTQAGFIASIATVGSDPTKKPVGTGPFMFKTWQPGQRLVVERNPGYWRQASEGPFLDAVEFRPIADGTTRAAQVFGGQLDANISSELNAASRVQGQGQGSGSIAVGAMTFVTLNTTKAPFDDADVRRALALSVDQAELLEKLGDASRQAITSPFPDDSPWCVSDTGFAGFDLSAATRLADAYQQRTGTPLRFNLQVPSTDEGTKVGAILQAMWARAGVQATVVPADRTSVVLSVVSGNYAAALLSQPPLPEPDQYYVAFHTTGAAEAAGNTRLNLSRISDPQIDDALERGRVSTDDDERRQIYGDFVRAVNHDVPYIWLYSTPQVISVSAKVHGADSLLSSHRTQTRPWAAAVWLAA